MRYGFPEFVGGRRNNRKDRNYRNRLVINLIHCSIFVLSTIMTVDMRADLAVRFSTGEGVNQASRNALPSPIVKSAFHGFPISIIDRSLRAAGIFLPKKNSNMIELIIYLATLLCPQKDHLHSIDCLLNPMSIENETGGETGNVPPGAPTPPPPPPPPPPVS